ncbi:hypothetical protein L0P88_22010 [Muricauda sp. SCSIO 64092]|uniref:hypothetical protein n=1 Tax=Allomuricauda sp. SCSIO 64092 TaxID=2908842 RepID=UPI001FF20FA7|nr:hypothetical protein [Muricauda sp. SCSIO 64092]UOY06585.1 hypothetical protein L0P88_22010 [Muricauda sp. SCSIO 64092]
MKTKIKIAIIAMMGMIMEGNAQDNKIDTTGDVGIGTTTPNAGLEIFRGDTNNLALLLKSSGAGWGSGLQLHNTASNNGFGIYSGSDGKWHFSHEGYGDRMVVDSNGNIGIGTTSPDMKLTVNGNIHAKEVKIDLNVPAPDYVFKSNYKLRSIEEVESFIKEHSHLPEIPSAKEFAKNGVMQAEMDMNLLKKIEELTLYTIEQEKKLKTQKEKFEQQQKEIEELKKQNSEIKGLKALVQKLLKNKN